MRRRLHPLVFWPLALAVAVGGACLLAAPVHDVLMDTGLMQADGSPADTNKAFLKVFRRLLLLPLAALFLWFFRPWRDGGLLRFGLRPLQPRVRGITVAFACTFATLLAVLIWQFAMGWLTWEEPFRVGKLVGRLVRYLAAGFLIAILEEWFFRGWLGEFAQRKHGPRLAVILPCLGYAVVHAFRPTVLDQPVSHDAAGALEALRGWFAFMFDLSAFGPALVGLFCFALMLTALYRRSGSLWPSIGAHAAGILVLFSYGAATQRDPARTWAGTRLLYDGPVVWAILLLAAWRLWPRLASQDASDRDAEAPADPSGAPPG